MPYIALPPGVYYIQSTEKEAKNVTSPSAHGSQLFVADPTTEAKQQVTPDRRENNLALRPDCFTIVAHYIGRRHGRHGESQLLLDRPDGESGRTAR